MDDSRYTSNADESTDSCDEDNEKPSSQERDSETESADSEAYHGDVSDDNQSLKSSPERTSVSSSGKNRNEVSAENNQIQNRDLVNKMDVDSDDEMYTSTAFPDIVICDVCYKKFSDKEQLWVHKRIRSPPVTYLCEECDIRFQTECSFETHKSFTHTPELFSPDR